LESFLLFSKLQKDAGSNISTSTDFFHVSELLREVLLQSIIPPLWHGVTLFGRAQKDISEKCD
jgi:hypothetical protein